MSAQQAPSVFKLPLSVWLECPWVVMDTADVAVIMVDDDHYPDHWEEEAAAELVLAVNSHAALVEALEKTLETARSWVVSELSGTGSFGPAMAELDRAEEVLALAKGYPSLWECDL